MSPVTELNPNKKNGLLRFEYRINLVGFMYLVRNVKGFESKELYK